jgi:hypothetical protein
MVQNWLKRLINREQETDEELPSESMVRADVSDGQGYREIIISSWKELRDTFEDPSYRSWAFRGQTNTRWSLYSSLSRHLQMSRVMPEHWKKQEERILRIFRRKAHLYLERVPDERDSFQWLALMQHHGAPTRLLDFTWSPYVAAFYALTRATEGTDAAIWALFPPALIRGALQTVRARQRVKPEEIGPWILGNYEKYFLPNKQPIALIGDPHHMNQRLIAHSGTFVIPGMLDMPVEKIISQHVDPQALVKFTLKTDRLRRDTIKELYRMNVTFATLFPDLDGLARSLELELELHWAYDPVTNEKFPRFEQD